MVNGFVFQTAFCYIFGMMRLLKPLIYMITAIHALYLVVKRSIKAYGELPDGQPYGRRVKKLAFYLLFAKRGFTRNPAGRNIVALKFIVTQRLPVMISRNLGEDLLRESKSASPRSGFYLFGLTFKDMLDQSVAEVHDPYKDPNQIYTKAEVDTMYLGFFDVIHLHADVLTLLDTRR